MSAILAGCVLWAMGGFVAFTLAGHLSGAEMTANWAKPAQSAAFAAALSLVIMAGADLFTGIISFCRQQYSERQPHGGRL